MYKTPIGAMVVAACLFLAACAGGHRTYQGAVSKPATAHTQAPQAGVVNLDGTVTAVENGEEIKQPMSMEAVPAKAGEQVSRPDELTEAILLQLGPRQSRMTPAPLSVSPSSSASLSSEQVSQDIDTYFDPNRNAGLPQSIMR